MKRTLVLALAAMMVLGVAGAAFADTVVYPTGPPAGPPATEAVGTVNVNAKVNSKITLSITTPNDGQTVDFGDVVPGVKTSKDVTLEVKSNKGWTSTKVVGGQSGLIGLTAEGFPASGNKGVSSSTDKYSLDVPWDTDPGDYTATVAYTVTQK